MGDLILGTLLVALIFFTYVVYRVRTRSLPHNRSRLRFVLLLLVVGAGLGVVTTLLNARLLERHPWVYAGSAVFFGVQAGAALLAYRRPLRSWALLGATLLAQVPVLALGNYSYHSQTFFGLLLTAGRGLAWDLEPGSYVSYHYIRQLFREMPFVPGVNLVPLVLLAVLGWRKATFGRVPHGAAPSPAESVVLAEASPPAPSPMERGSPATQAVDSD
jgi:hypothetical protein